MAYTSKIQSLREWKDLSSCKISGEIHSSSKPVQKTEINTNNRKKNSADKILAHVQVYLKEKLYLYFEQIFSRIQPEYLAQTVSYNESFSENEDMMKLPELFLGNNLRNFFRRKKESKKVNVPWVSNNLIENTSHETQALPNTPLLVKEENHFARVFYFFHFNLYKVLKINAIIKLFQESVKGYGIAVKVENFMKYYTYRFLDILYETMEKIAERTSSSIDKQQYRADIL